MSGSFVPERDDEPVRYGIVKQLGSFNILWAAVHEWVGIAKDVWAAPWRHKLSYLWREPGWSHDGRRMTSDMIRDRWRAGRAAEEAAEYFCGVLARSISDEAISNYRHGATIDGDSFAPRSHSKCPASPPTYITLCPTKPPISPPWA